MNPLLILPLLAYTLVAVPLGLLLGSVPVLNTGSRAIVEFLRPIPSVAMIPLAELLLGSGLGMEVPLVVFASVWPILFNTMYGLQDVDPVAKETLRSFGFGPVPVLIRVSLPSAGPFIATGVRLAAAVALIVAVSSEFLAGFGDGLGIFISQAQSVPGGALDVLAGTVWAGTLGLIIATKSLARFKALEDREFAEYFLIGTLASLLLALLGGLAMRALL